MSDNDDFMLEDDEDYGFDYEDDDEEEGEGEDGGTESLHLALENKYYSAKAVKEESPKEALQLFRQVMELDRNNPNTKSDW
jgi:COP9 signalosome complex subunit 2